MVKMELENKVGKFIVRTQSNIEMPFVGEPVTFYTTRVDMKLGNILSRLFVEQFDRRKTVFHYAYDTQKEAEKGHKQIVADIRNRPNVYEAVVSDPHFASKVLPRWRLR